MNKQDFDLHSAFPAMPEECRCALSTAARSVKEEKEPMKRKYPVAILVAAILTLMTTIAIAEGVAWTLMLIALILRMERVRRKTKAAVK